MEYLILAKNGKTGKWDAIGTSKEKKVSDFWIAGRINYLHILNRGAIYTASDIKVVKKEEGYDGISLINN